MDDISAPRPLNPDEAEDLTALLKSHLRLHNCSCAIQAEADSVDLLNYALDMIEDGETVGKVLEELDFMEMEICNYEVLENMRLSLAEFLAKMHKEAGKKNWREMLEDRNQQEVNTGPKDYEEQLLESENHVAVDLSAKTAADKHKQDMQRLFGGGGQAAGAASSIKNRYQQQLNADKVENKKGRLKEGKEWRVDANGAADSDNSDEISVEGTYVQMRGGKTIDEMRREELMEIMNDRTLNKTEKSQKMGEVRAKYGLAESKQATKRANKIAVKSVDQNSHFNRVASGGSTASGGNSMGNGGVDLSAKAAAAKNSREMASLFGGGQARATSLKDRMSMYNKNGEIVKQTQDVEENTAQEVKEKTNDELRREELMAIMKDKSLDKKEKTKRMEEVRDKYGTSTAQAAAAASAPPSSSAARGSSNFGRESSLSSNGSSEGDGDEHESENPLSSKAAAKKHKREIESLFGRGKAGNAMSSNRQNYEQQLIADRVHKPGVHEDKNSRHGSASFPAKLSGISRHHSSGSGDQSEASANTNSDNNAPPPPLSLPQQRRAELQLIMQDKTLNKDERRKKMDEVKEQYALLEQEQQEPEHQEQAEHRGSNEGGYENNNGHRVANTDYNVEAATQQGGIDLSAKSRAEREKREVEQIAMQSVSDRKHMYHNQQTIVAGRNQKPAHVPKNKISLYERHRNRPQAKVDPTAFAMAENGIYGIQNNKKKATRHEYAGRF